MFELNGKYASAKVFADNVDEKAITQVIDLLNQPYAAGSTIRMMPDIHAGAGCTIGTTMTITDKVCPNLVGVDVGCGMNVVKVRGSIDPEQLDSGKWIKHAQGIVKFEKEAQDGCPIFP
mgnify:FL=1